MMCADCVDQPGTVEVQRVTYKGKRRKVMVCERCAARGGAPASIPPIPSGSGLVEAAAGPVETEPTLSADARVHLRDLIRGCD
jgi:hypothetical protein